MTTRKILGTALALATLSLAGCQGEDIDRETSAQELSVAAAAETKPSVGPEFRHGPRDPATWFSRLDQDGDGRVLVAELPERGREHLTKADLDGDGTLTLAELTTAHAAGKLQPRGDHGKFGHAPPSAERLLAHFDANEDGKLTLSELPERMRERLQASDANADGVLDPAEITTHLAAMKARFESRD